MGETPKPTERTVSHPIARAYGPNGDEGWQTVNEWANFAYNSANLVARTQAELLIAARSSNRSNDERPRETRRAAIQSSDFSRDRRLP